MPASARRAEKAIRLQMTKGRWTREAQRWPISATRFIGTWTGGPRLYGETPSVQQSALATP